jgi:hypothetical protein
VASYLVVAHQTAECPQLRDRLLAIAGEDQGARFSLIVPATPITHRLVWEEGETHAAARDRARSAASRWRTAGLPVVRAEVGDSDPVQAIADELRTRVRYDGIVISTLPARVSRWLRLDVLSRARRLFPEGRIIHVVGEKDGLPARLPAREDSKAERSLPYG